MPGGPSECPRRRGDAHVGDTVDDDVQVLTVVPLGKICCCSLTTTRPPKMGIVWFGCPVTAIGTPLMERPSTVVSPAPAPPRTAAVRAMTNPAEIAFPAMVRPMAASDASAAA